MNKNLLIIDAPAIQYSNIIVALGNPEVRLSLLNRIKEETPYRIVSLVSPKAYVSPSALCSGEVYKRKDTIKTEDLFFDPQKWAESLTDISKRTPKKLMG